MLNESGENVDFLDTPSPESQDGQEVSVEDQRVAEPEVPDQQISQEPTPVEPQFSHPHLQGKSPAEIESLFNLMQNTVQSQTRRINELATVPTPTAPAEVGVEPKGDFFDDPLTHMRRELRTAVAPINEEIANLKAQALVNSAWESVGMKFHDFEKYRSHVEAMLQNMGVGPAQVTPDLLESLYYGAKGYIATHEANIAPAPSEVPSQAPPPPQHRPSSAPLPRSNAGQPRQLTEDERRLAREFNLTPEEFIEWGEKDEGDVANAEVAS